MAEGRTVPAGQWAGGGPASCVPSSRSPGEEIQVPLVQDLVLEGQKQDPGVSRLSGRWAGLGAGQGGHCGVDLDHPLWGPSGLNKGTGTWPGLRLPFTALPGCPPQSRSAARALGCAGCSGQDPGDGRLSGFRAWSPQLLPGGVCVNCRPLHERDSPSRLLAERTQWAGEDPGQQNPSQLRPSPRPAAPGSDPGQRFPSGLVCPHACRLGGGCLPAVSCCGGCRGGSVGPRSGPAPTPPPGGRQGHPWERSCRPWLSVGPMEGLSGTSWTCGQGVAGAGGAAGAAGSAQLCCCVALARALPSLGLW